MPTLEPFADDSPERLHRRTAETLRHRAAREAVRNAKARRRVHGMIERNAGRLAGARARARRSAAVGGPAPPAGRVTTSGGCPIRESSAP